MLITFTGRLSGKRYTTPVGYVQKGNILLLGVGGAWWKNLRGGAPVQVRLRGKAYLTRAQVFTDEPSVTRIYDTILAENPTQARFMGITSAPNGQPDHHDVVQALQRGAAVVEIDLTNPT